MNIKNKGFNYRPENINKKGRPSSLKNELRNLLKADGEIEIKAKNVIRINENGNVRVKIPTSESLVLRLLQIASSGKNTNTLKAIQLIFDRLDGRPRQTMDFEMAEIRPLETIRRDPKTYSSVPKK